MGIAVSRRRFWSVVQTEFNSEALASRSVAALGIESYNPQYRPRAAGGVRTPRSLLDRYLLVRLCPRAGWDGIERARGVRGLMRGADGGELGPPARVEDEKIAWIRSLEDDLGYVVLEDEEPPSFAFAAQVVALRGSFRDQRGTYRGVDQQNQRRAIVAFEILGREVLSSQIRYDLALA